MINKTNIKLAMPIALIVFGVLMLLGMDSIATAIRASTNKPIQLDLQGLDKVKVLLAGSEEESPIVVRTKLFSK